MNIHLIRSLITGTRTDPHRIGRAFEVEFTKANGERRKMRARLGMRRNLTGRGMAYDPFEYDLMTVWELGNNYRNVPLDRITGLRVPDSSKHLRRVI